MASRERDDAMAGLLKRTLAGDAGAGNDCPAPDILAAYFERSLGADETARLELHFSQCAHCREQVAALVRAEAEAPVQVDSSTAPQRASRASWLFDWRWLAPVAAVLIFTVVWATRRSTLTGITNHTAETASIPSPGPAAQAPVAALPQKALPVQPSHAPAIDEKKQLSSRVAPQAAGMPAPPNSTALKESAAVNLVDHEKSADVEGSPSQTLQPPNSVANLPLNGRNYTPLDSLSKSAPAAPRPSANQAANAIPSATSESVTVEAETESIATTPATPSGAPASPKTGTTAGVAGGMITSGGANSKQERTAMGVGSIAEKVTVEQSAQAQRSTSFLVQTPDKNTLWRIGYSGFVERSVDGGAAWQGTLPRQNAHYAAGSAPGANVCWLVGGDGLILLTRDGSHWQTIPPPVQADLVAVAARDAWNATVTTSDGRKFTTSDQGASWIPAE